MSKQNRPNSPQPQSPLPPVTPAHTQEEEWPIPAPESPKASPKPEKEVLKMPPMFCGHCAHFKQEAYGSTCHLAPPTYSVARGKEWPPVNGANGCGHWETQEMLQARKQMEWMNAPDLLAQMAKSLA